MTIASYLSVNYPQDQVSISYFDSVPLPTVAVALGLTNSQTYFQMERRQHGGSRG